MRQKNNHVVIMAGGVGSRFWPMGTPECPKQFVDVLGTGRSLLQMTFDRFRNVVPVENVWVVTSSTYASLVEEQLPEIPSSNILREPCRRNTAPCIAYASWRIKAIDPTANVVVTPSDHVVLNVSEFQRVILSTLQFAEETDSIVTLGIKPSRPETGFGYIQCDLTYSTARHKEIYRVDKFHEKPDLATAQQYIAQNNFFWNSGIFVWNVSTIVNAFRIYQPEMSRIFEDLLPIYGTPQEQSIIDKQFPLCENISVDYAIMEKTEEIFVCPSNFGWGDLGTWRSLYSIYQVDSQGNAVIGNNVTVLESANCIIHTAQEKKVIIQGLDGFIVAEKNDSLLICRMSEEQRIRQITSEH